MSNKLVTPCQSVFIKGDSWVNQLVAITHDIHKNLDADPSIDTIEVFWGMSKALDKVDNGLIVWNSVIQHGGLTRTPDPLICD